MGNRVLMVVLCALTAFCFQGCSRTRQKKTVYVAERYGFDSTNATAVLQAALDSGAERVVITRQESDWYSEPLFIRSNQEVVLEDGVVIRALPGAYETPQDCLLNIVGVTNVALRGNGKVQVRMERDAYADRSRYRFSEWRHTLRISRSAKVGIYDLELSHSGGDGVYVCQSEDVVLSHLNSHDHYRQGISVISARHLRVLDSKFCNTRGTAPQFGIDFEPNNDRDFLEDCVVENCEFDANGSGGMLFHFLQLDKTTSPVSILVRNCRMRGNASYGVQATLSKDGREPVSGSIRFENCVMEENANGPLALRGLSAKTPVVTLANCLLDDLTACRGVVFDNGDLSEDFGGVCFEDCLIKTDLKQPISFSARPGCGIGVLPGSLTRIGRVGEASPFSFASFAAAHRSDPIAKKAFGHGILDYKSLRPIDADARPKGVYPYLREKFEFLQYMPGAGVYDITFRAKWLGKRIREYHVLIRDWDGTDRGTVVITQDLQVVSLVANGRNLYRLGVNTKGHAVSVSSSHAGQGLRMDNPVNVFSGLQRYYFNVPESAGRVVVSLRPEEPASATLYDAANREVAAFPRSMSSGLLSVDRQVGTQEIWSLAVNAVEDLIIRVGSSVTPIFSCEKNAGLR